MARVAYVNGQYVMHQDAVVHVEDRGYQFADGIYEYMAFYNHTLLDGDLHLARLERSCKALHIAMPMSVKAMELVIRELIERNGRTQGGIYIQVSRGVARRDHPFPKDTKPALVMTVCAAKLPKATEINDGVKVITQPDIRWLRRDIKSVSLLANVLAKQEASKRHTREAWLVESDGTISEGSVSNSYIINQKGELVTHNANEHILGGITREVVLRLARKAGIAVDERPYNMVEVKSAAEAFLTSTSANVLPVVQVDDITIGDGKVGPITRKLQTLYNEHIFKQTGWAA
ncbi:MAG: D-amino-acid transaminase [Rickettsiales bacterium]|nr:D-amino-acid transaminase [Rickettsiales bacterium]